jgi:hypothetical protein
LNNPVIQMRCLVSLLTLLCLITLICLTQVSNAASRRRLDKSPEAVACRAEATEKHPSETIELPPRTTPNGMVVTGSMVKRDPGYQAYYDDCMAKKRALIR